MSTRGAGETSDELPVLEFTDHGREMLEMDAVPGGWSEKHRVTMASLSRDNEIKGLAAVSAAFEHWRTKMHRLEDCARHIASQCLGSVAATLKEHVDSGRHLLCNVCGWKGDWAIEQACRSLHLSAAEANHVSLATYQQLALHLRSRGISATVKGHSLHVSGPVLSFDGSSPTQ